jgi:two-component system, NarL family, response regulator NreC
VIHVVLADDHHLVRQGIRALLAQAGDIEVVGEAEDGPAAIELAQRLTPDVLVMDIGMPRMSGIEAIAQIHSLHLPTQMLILSMYSDEILVRQALRNGARGYLLKRSVVEELLLAVRAVHRSETYLSPQISNAILADFLARRDGTVETSLFDRLSPRERQVLQLVAEGRTNNEIAETLQIAVKTVEKHRASLMAKLKVQDLAGLLRKAMRHGLIVFDEPL